MEEVAKLFEQTQPNPEGGPIPASQIRSAQYTDDSKALGSQEHLEEIDRDKE